MFSRELYWDFRILDLTRRGHVSIRHRNSKLFKGCSLAKHLYGGFIQESNPDIEFELIPDGVMLDCRRELLVPGDYLRMTWSFQE